jgi:hypothetical protein
MPFVGLPQLVWILLIYNNKINHKKLGKNSSIKGTLLQDMPITFLYIIPMALFVHSLTPHATLQVLQSRK